MKKPNMLYPGLLILAVFLSAALYSCRGEGRGAADAGEPFRNAGRQAPGAPELITDAGQLPGILDYEGQFLQAARWPGEGSTYYAIVSKYEQGEFFSPSRVSRLNIYLFEIDEGQVAGRRAFQAEAPNNFSKVELLGDRSQAIRLPSVGIAFSIVYSVCPENAGPCSLFSSVIGAEGKYDFQVQEDVEPSVYLEARQSMMAGIPEDVQQHMLEQLFEYKNVE